MIIGGVVFGMFAGINYWFPKAFGFKLDPFWGKVSFWCWVVGFWVAFMPLYVLGLMGVTAPAAHVRGSFAADLVRDRGLRRLPDPGRHRSLPDPDLRQHPRARGAARRDRRSLERAHFGMVHLLSAACL